MTEYFGQYASFSVPSKKDAGQLLGPDNSDGDLYSLDVEMQDGEQRAWLVNAFGQRVGYLDHPISRQIRTLQAEGLATHAILSFVAYTDHPGTGHYWGQVALVCFSLANEQKAAAFHAFLANVQQRLADGLRTNVALSAQAVQRVIDSEGAWVPSETMPLPENDKGTAYLKRHRNMKERLIAQGRAGNKGCYVLSWIFLLAVVALVVFALKSCFA